MPNEPIAPPAPCGYCRRCAIHDDPGGCLVVEQWERENPEAAIALIQAAGMAGGQWRVDELRAIIDARDPFGADPAEFFPHLADEFSMGLGEINATEGD